MSAAIEAAADQPFLTFMRDQIFQPLGMDHTYAESATEENPEHVGEPQEDCRLSISYGTCSSSRGGSGRRRPDGRHLMRPHNLSCYAGSMAFLSTPSDMVRFGLAVNNGTLLRPATVQLLQTSQRLPSGKETGYGLGWDLERVTLAGAPAQAAGHDGESLGGQVVSLVTFRERGIVVAVMSNIAYADTSALALKVADAFAR